jgi:hypothetical protein
MNEDGQDVLPKRRGSRRSLMSEDGRQVTLGDAYVLENKAVSVLVHYMEEEAGSDITVLKNQFGYLDASFDVLEQITQLVEVNHRHSSRLQFVREGTPFDVC